MKRQVLILAGAVAFVAALVVPAGASSAAVAPPAAPLHVAVSGTSSLDATVTWAAPRSTPTRITGYTVTIRPAEQQPDHGIDTLPANARSDRFGALTAGTTYSFAVRSTSRTGTSSAVTVRYTAPAPPAPLPQSFTALSASGAVERFPISGGPGTVVVPSGGDGYTVDDVGDVLVPATGGTSIVVYPAAGGAARTIATGLSITGALQIDVPGDVFFQSGSQIVELPVTGAAQRTVGPVLGPWTVAADGTVTTVTAGGGYDGDITAVATYPLSGAATTRQLTSEYQEAALAIEADGHGDVFVLASAVGPQWTGWYELPAGSSTLTMVQPTLLDENGAAYPGGFVEVHDAELCSITTAPSLRCTQAQLAITGRTAVAADGMRTETPASGLDLSALGLGENHVGAVDDGGDLLLDVSTGDTTGLSLVPAGGGAAKRLDTGQFSELQVNSSL